MTDDPVPSPDITTNGAPPAPRISSPDAPLTPIEARYIWVLRAHMALPLFVLLLLIAVAEYRLFPRNILSLSLPLFTFTTAMFVAKSLLIWHFPARRLAHIAYHMGSDHLRITRGYIFRTDTLLPFSRVQHIDVGQGPLERGLGLASLTIHTSAILNQAVTLPGLNQNDAAAMRAAIHQRIQMGQE